MRAASKMTLQISVLLVGVFISSVTGEDLTTSTVQVKTSKGVVIGWINGTMKIFQGIPYAKPPVKSLRFQPPQDPDAWSSPLSVQKFGSACVQFGRNDTNEDCLSLNVFTPVSGSGLPVMVWIHGGSYTSGSAKDFPVEAMRYYTNQGVIVVSINYRLNVFGYFSTSTSAYPPNAGMLDQVKALNWVKTEIKAFGGDPTKVTIFGESAGSGSVSLHTYSPLSKGLFSKAIQQSGSAYCPWAFDRTGTVSNQISRNVAVGSGCITANDWDAKKFSNMPCLQNLTANQLLSLGADVKSNYYPWRPTLDAYANRFMPTLPEHSTPANVPSIIGTNHDEGTFNMIVALFNGQLIPANLTLTALQGQFWKIAGQNSGGNTATQTSIFRLLDLIYYPRYYTSSNINLQVFKAIGQAYSGWDFFGGVVRDIELKSSKNPNVFVYSFDFVSPTLPWIKDKNGNVYSAVFHAMDLWYVFPTIKVDGFAWPMNDTDHKIQTFFVNQWTTFAKTGKPTNWPARKNSSDTSYLSINTTPKMLPYYHLESSNLWNTVIPAINSQSAPSTTPPPCVPATMPTGSAMCNKAGMFSLAFVMFALVIEFCRF